MVIIYADARAYYLVCVFSLGRCDSYSRSGNMLNADAINFDSAWTSSAYIIHYVNETLPPV